MRGLKALHNSFRLEDKRSLFGKNVHNILKLCGINEGFDVITPRSAKLFIRYWPDVEDERWRQSIAKELIEIREGTREVDGFTKTEIQQMLLFVCTE